MSKIMPVAQTIKGDEKAVGLTETNYKTPDQKGLHRYQCIYVIRDDKTAEFTIDMGPAENFKGVNLINIPSLLEHTVDELKDIADEIRGQELIDVRELIGVDKVKRA